MRSFFRVFVVLSLTLAITLCGVAQTKEKQPAKGMPSQADQEKMMAEMMKAMKPGPQHDLLAKMAGDWNVVGQMWMDPKGEPMPMKPGTEHAEMILGGATCSPSIRAR